MLQDYTDLQLDQTIIMEREIYNVEQIIERGERKDNSVRENRYGRGLRRGWRNLYTE